LELGEKSQCNKFVNYIIEGTETVEADFHPSQKIVEKIFQEAVGITIQNREAEETTYPTQEAEEITNLPQEVVEILIREVQLIKETTEIDSTEIDLTKNMMTK
jgi:hypothetical protein